MVPTMLPIRGLGRTDSLVREGLAAWADRDTHALPLGADNKHTLIGFPRDQSSKMNFYPTNLFALLDWASCEPSEGDPRK